MLRTADFLIIGGGIIGCSIAYNLAARRAGHIVVLERDELLGQGSTGRCAGGFRLQFSSRVNICLSLESVRIMEHFAEEVGTPLELHQDGYLFLLTRGEDLDSFRRSVVLQQSLGVPVEWLTPQEAARLVPGLQTGDVLAATFCARDGIVDVGGLLNGYAMRARELGVEFIRRAEVTAIGGRVVRSSAGEFEAPLIVNAAGPQAAVVARMAGHHVPVAPQRRHVAVTGEFPGRPFHYTMVIDFASTLYFHRESGGALLGMADPQDPPGENLTVDWGFLGTVLERGAERFPPLAHAHIAKAWAGLYEMTPDAHPVVGFLDENFFVCAGFSGHGLQHAPAIGLVVAEWLTDGRPRSVDLTALRPSRFEGPGMAVERNVV